MGKSIVPGALISCVFNPIELRQIIAVVIFTNAYKRTVSGEAIYPFDWIRRRIEWPTSKILLLDDSEFNKLTDGVLKRIEEVRSDIENGFYRKRQFMK